MPWFTWLLRRVGEEDAADAVQRTVLPWTLEKPWEQPSTPFRKAQERIVKLEALVDERKSPATAGFSLLRGETERRRSRTDPAWGCQTSPVLKA
jgi:hypothetical protein